jgi:hypothetical protein
VGTTVSLRAGATTDLDDQRCPRTLTFEWSVLSAPAGSQATVAPANSPTPSFVPDVVGAYQFAVTVKDSDGDLSVPRFLTVTTDRCGSSPPTLLPASVHPPSPKVGEFVILALAATDPDNDAVSCGPRFSQTVTFASAFLDTPTTSSLQRLGGAASANPSFVPDAPGSYLVSVTATDSTGLSTHSQVTVLVRSNQCGFAPPVVSGSGSTIPALPRLGSPVTVGFNASDPDAATCPGPLRYESSLIAVPDLSRAAIVPPNSPTPTFIPDVPGVYRVRMKATDVDGQTGEGEASVAVTCGAAAPVVVGANALPGSIGTPTIINVGMRDVDNDAGCNLGQTLTAHGSFESVPAGSHLLALAPASASGGPLGFVADVPGNYVVRVVAKDDAGLESAPFVVYVPISQCGVSEPAVDVVVVPPEGRATVGSEVTLQVTASDPDYACGFTQPVRTSATFLSAPAGTALRELSPPFGTRPSFIPDKPGMYSVLVEATDDTDRTGQKVVNIPVCGAATPTVTTRLLAQNGPEFVIRAEADDADNVTPCALNQAFTFEVQVRVPPGAADAVVAPGMSSPTAADFAITVEARGEYVARVTVTDPLTQQSTFYDLPFSY